MTVTCRAKQFFEDYKGLSKVVRRYKKYYERAKEAACEEEANVEKWKQTQDRFEKAGVNLSNLRDERRRHLIEEKITIAEKELKRLKDRAVQSKRDYEMQEEKEHDMTEVWDWAEEIVDEDIDEDLCLVEYD